MIAAAARDQRVTDDELDLLCHVVSVLGIDEGVVHAGVQQWRHPADGAELPRAILCDIAVQMGLCVVDWSPRNTATS